MASARALLDVSAARPHVFHPAGLAAQLRARSRRFAPDNVTQIINAFVDIGDPAVGMHPRKQTAMNVGIVPRKCEIVVDGSKDIGIR